jgi:DNA replication licensing factor MCM7
LVESIEKNTKRYIDVISQAVDNIMPKETKDVTYVEALASTVFQTN